MPATTFPHRVRLWLGILLLAAMPLPALAAKAGMPPTTITVAMDDNYPPYIFRDDKGRLQGILKDTWALWEARSGIRVQLEAMDWGKAQQVMQEGKADVIDTIFETPQRKKIYDFSQPYARIEVPIFFHKSISGISNAESLKGFTVGVKDGDACIDTLAAQGISNLIRFPSYETMLKTAANGDVKIMCIDKPPALYLLHKLGLEQTFRYSPPLTSGEFHWAVHKGQDALYQTVAAGFAKISPAEREAIEKKWLGTEVDGPGLSRFARYTAYLVLATLSATLLLGMWATSLRRLIVRKTGELSDTLHTLQATQAMSEKTLDYLNATLEAIPDLLFELDGDGTYIDYRAARTDLLAAPPDQLIGRTVWDVMPPATAQIVLDALQEALRQGSSYGKQICLALPQGEHWFELSVAPKKSATTEQPHFIVLSRDITERKKAEAEIERLAFFDPLTQLPNRRLIFDRLRQALAASQRHKSYGAVLFIDLDNFKTLNDTQGHKAGDLLLKEIAQRLQGCVRAEDSLARLGGDEFVVLLEELNPKVDEAAALAEMIGEKILHQIGNPYLLDGHEYHTSASIGICLFAGKNESVDEIMKRADAAMYRAKTSGRNTIRFFDPAMQATLEARAKLESALRRALPEKQLELYYQSQVDSRERIIGAEVLLRWNHPEKGMVSPLQFISLAEETGLIVPIGHWVLEEACAQLKQWEASPLTRCLILSVNVSARQFRQNDFVQQLQDILQRQGIEPSRLKLELTESLVLDNVADSIEKMHALKSFGVPFSMDDFGTGYSSLSYLKRLPLEQLKIDQTFVRDIVTDPGDAVIVRTIIGMARNLGLDVIAEGVETQAQKDFLLQNDCLKFQGYLFSRPLPLAGFKALLDSQEA